MDSGIRGHSRLKLAMGVFHIYFDAVDELHSLFGGLHVLRSKLGFGGDEDNLSRIDFSRVAVCVYGNLLPELDSSQIRLVDIGFQPGFFNVSQGGYRSTGNDKFTGFRIFYENDPGNGAYRLLYSIWVLITSMDEAASFTWA